MRKILYFAFAALLAVAFASCEKKSNKGTGDEPASWVNPNSQDGVMLHTFSVAANRPVRFSQGNLQYRASTGTWRFAPNQWEMRGEENNQRGEDYSGWIDLFCWGATGYNGRLPYVVPTSSKGFEEPQSGLNNTDYDWGHYLPIANGGNQANRWRTLTGEEWTYLFRGRPQAERLFGFATVNGVEGIILLPDVWDNPVEVLSFVPGADKGLNWESAGSGGAFYDRIGNDDHYKDNKYSAADWNAMEKAGAIFLPAAGSYANGSGYGSNKSKFGYNRGYYWSATRNGQDYAYAVDFSSNPTDAFTCFVPAYPYAYVQFAMAVRLVR